MHRQRHMIRMDGAAAMGWARLDRSGGARYLGCGQNKEPEGTGNGLVPPVPFGSKVDGLLSPAAARQNQMGD